MKRVVAVFDIDGTIIKDNSTRMFLQYLFRQNEIIFKDFLNFCSYFFRTCFKDWINATKGNKFFLRGKKYSHLFALGEKCFREKIAPQVSSIAIGKIKEHRKLGHEVVLLSGTIDVLLKQFQQYLGIEKAFGAVLETGNGIITGSLKEDFPYAQNKVQIVTNNFNHNSYDLSSSYTYANSEADLPMFELFGHPVLVNPANNRLISVAEKKKIEVTYF